MASGLGGGGRGGAGGGAGRAATQSADGTGEARLSIINQNITRGGRSSTGPKSRQTSTLCSIRMTICIGPYQVQQRRRSRAHQKQQEIPGSTYPDHEVKPWKYPITPPPPQEAGDRCWATTLYLHRLMTRSACPPGLAGSRL